MLVDLAIPRSVRLRDFGGGDHYVTRSSGLRFFPRGRFSCCSSVSDEDTQESLDAKVDSVNRRYQDELVSYLDREG